LLTLRIKIPCKTQFKHDMVDIGKDHVTVNDARGEVVHWVDDEWKEDPEVVPCIFNAMAIAASGRSVREYLRRNGGA